MYRLTTESHIYLLLRPDACTYMHGIITNHSWFSRVLASHQVSARMHADVNAKATISRPSAMLVTF